jgi:hypothetical protein
MFGLGGYPYSVIHSGRLLPYLKVLEKNQKKNFSGIKNLAYFAVTKKKVFKY